MQVGGGGGSSCGNSGGTKGNFVQTGLQILRTEGSLALFDGVSASILRYEGLCTIHHSIVA